MQTCGDSGNGQQRTGHAPPRYAELQVTSNFTFLAGASHVDELVDRAAELRLRAIAMTDTNTLAGVVRAHVAAREVGVSLIVGCRLVFTGPMGLSLLVYPTDRIAYGRLCRLLTAGKRRSPKGECRLQLHDLVEHNQGLLAVVIPPQPPALPDSDFLDTLAGLRRVFDNDRLSIAASCLYGSDDRGHLNRLIALSDHVRVPLVATNDVYYHRPSRRPLQDVLACIRMGCTLDTAGLGLFANAERHLKSPEEMNRLFIQCPGAIRRGLDLAERAGGFSLDQLRYQYPHEVCPAGLSAMEHLVALTKQGGRQRYPSGMPTKVDNQIRHELTLIDELGYAPYFLTVYDMVAFARSRSILCQGRGAAANSAVCYCLGITAVDPDRIDLLFERFISRQRNEPPDIDIDFEHERREEVIQYLYQKYGRHRAALAAEVVTYRPRSAVRDVGKALGLSPDCVDRVAKHLDRWGHGMGDRGGRDVFNSLGLGRHEPTVQRLVDLVGQVVGFPRHLSQHVGGFVITEDPLCELVPIENARMADRTVIEWDKNDIDAMGMLKVDVLGLGMLTCIRKALGTINETGSRQQPLTLYNIPPGDTGVYNMVCRADTIGVFQIESRAQMSMLPRLRPRTFYDLVIEVAVVRPGPIQGEMVHPYLRRRNGEEPVAYPSENIKRVLEKTLGVPLFQEQVMSLAVVAAGFSPGEADRLRCAIAAWKNRGKDRILEFETRFVEGMVGRGYSRDFAGRCFDQIKGFGGYGFPESHAASFALLVYVSAWLKHHYPAVFAASLLNSQPMGFYAPAQIVRDAREHGVVVLPVDVNHSDWDCTLEAAGRGTACRSDHENGAGSLALRLGMRLVKALEKTDAHALVSTVRRDGPFGSIRSLWRTAGVKVASLKRLARADAFGSMGIDRQAALWQIQALGDPRLPVFGHDTDPSQQEETPKLPLIGGPDRVAWDYRSTGLSLKAHPVSFIRSGLDGLGVVTNVTLRDQACCPAGAAVSVAGVVLVRQRPGTASGMVFMTIEDETATANLVVRPGVYDRNRQAVRHSVAVLVRGRVQRQGDVVHVVANRIQNITRRLNPIPTASRDFH